jgi:hypothetical protein
MPQKKSARLPPLPNLPVDLVPLAENAVECVGDVSALATRLEEHAEELTVYACELGQAVCNALSQRKLKSRKSGLQRELHADYFASGLRDRIWMMLDLCIDLRIPPPKVLVALLARMDRRPIRPSSWFTAAMIYAQARSEGDRTLSVSALARMAAVPRGTLRGRMARDEWARAVEDHLAGLRGGFRVLYFRPKVASTRPDKTH